VDTTNKADGVGASGPAMGRRGFLALALAAAVTGLAGVRALFGGDDPRKNEDTDGPGDRRKGNVADVTARYWVGGDRLAG